MNPDVIFFSSTYQEPSSLLADLACMLLSNLSKIPGVCTTLLGLRFGRADAQSPPLALDSLVDVFVRGDSKAVNEHATFDFLASVFANVSLVRISHFPLRISTQVNRADRGN
jgi:hypothetical protein